MMKIGKKKSCFKENGADPKIVDSAGRTPLEIASINHQQNTFFVLFENKGKFFRFVSNALFHFEMEKAQLL